MPGFIGKKLCPELEIVRGNYKKYGAESRVFSGIFEEYDPELSMGSLDEAYLDITEYVAERAVPKAYARIRYSGDCSCRLPHITVDELEKEMGSKLEAAVHARTNCPKCSKERWIVQDQVEFGIGRQEIVREIRYRVEQATGLTCSAGKALFPSDIFALGIAANFMLAKICSDMNKPNGQYDLPNERDKIIQFLKDLPIRKVSGIGGVSESHLKAANINTVGEMWERRAILPAIFSPHSVEGFLRVSMGLQRASSGPSDDRRKSISVESTFHPTDDKAKLLEKLRELSDDLASQLERAQIRGGFNVAVKIKLATFDVMTRAHTVDKLTNSADDIFITAEKILKKELGPEIRLLGVRLSKLEFLDDDTPKKTRIDQYLTAKNQTEPETSKKQRHASDSEDLFSSDGDEKPVARCPLCNKILPVDDEREVNSHLDECLNADLIGSLKPGTSLTAKPVASTKATKRKQPERNTQSQAAKKTKAPVGNIKKFLRNTKE
ncbi:unnamed protein product, partial [Mesorhabditis spiculigera]